jgi:hypothetical protein
LPAAERVTRMGTVAAFAAAATDMAQAVVVVMTARTALGVAAMLRVATPFQGNSAAQGLRWR